MTKPFLEEEFDKITPNTKHGFLNPLSNKPGCYCVQHNNTGNVYVGSTKNLAKRISQTTSSLRKNTHKNKNLQQLYNKDPEINFFIKLTETVEKAQEEEQQAVDKLKDSDNLCNVAVKDVVLTRLGAKLSEEHKDILMSSNINRKVSEETRRRQSESQKVFINTPEGKELLRQKIEKLSRKISIGGVEYPSISEASRQLGIKYTTLVRKYNL